MKLKEAKAILFTIPETAITYQNGAPYLSEGKGGRAWFEGENITVRQLQALVLCLKQLSHYCESKMPKTKAEAEELYRSRANGCIDWDKHNNAPTIFLDEETKEPCIRPYGELCLDELQSILMLIPTSIKN